MARARCSVRDPWPVPDSRISNGCCCCGSFVLDGGETWMSSKETMRLASAE